MLNNPRDLVTKILSYFNSPSKEKNTKRIFFCVAVALISIIFILFICGLVQGDGPKYNLSKLLPINTANPAKNHHDDAPQVSENSAEYGKKSTNVRIEYKTISSSLSNGSNNHGVHHSQSINPSFTSTGRPDETNTTLANITPTTTRQNPTHDVTSNDGVKDIPSLASDIVTLNGLTTAPTLTQDSDRDKTVSNSSGDNLGGNKKDKNLTPDTSVAQDHKKNITTLNGLTTASTTTQGSDTHKTTSSSSGDNPGGNKKDKNLKQDTSVAQDHKSNITALNGPTTAPTPTQGSDTHKTASSSSGDNPGGNKKDKNLTQDKSAAQDHKSNITTLNGLTTAPTTTQDSDTDKAVSNSLGDNLGDVKQILSSQRVIIDTSKSKHVTQSSEVAITTSEVAITTSEVAITTSEVAITTSEVSITKSEVAITTSEVAKKSPEVVTKPSEVVTEPSEVAIKSPEVAIKSPEVVTKSSEVVTKPSEVAIKLPEVVTKSSEVSVSVPLLPSNQPPVEEENRAANTLPLIPPVIIKCELISEIIKNATQKKTRSQALNTFQSLYIEKILNSQQNLRLADIFLNETSRIPQGIIVLPNVTAECFLEQAKKFIAKLPNSSAGNICLPNNKIAESVNLTFSMGETYDEVLNNSLKAINDITSKDQINFTAKIIFSECGEIPDLEDQLKIWGYTKECCVRIAKTALEGIQRRVKSKLGCSEANDAKGGGSGLLGNIREIVEDKGIKHGIDKLGKIIGKKLEPLLKIENWDDVWQILENKITNNSEYLKDCIRLFANEIREGVIGFACDKLLTNITDSHTSWHDKLSNIQTPIESTEFMRAFKEETGINIDEKNKISPERTISQLAGDFCSRYPLKKFNAKIELVAESKLAFGSSNGTALEQNSGISPFNKNGALFCGGNSAPYCKRCTWYNAPPPCFSLSGKHFFKLINIKISDLKECNRDNGFPCIKSSQINCSAHKICQNCVKRENIKNRDKVLFPCKINDNYIIIERRTHSWLD